MDKVLICSNLLLLLESFTFLAVQLYMVDQFSYLFVIACIMASAPHGSQFAIQCMLPIRIHGIGVWAMFISIDIACVFFNMYVLIFTTWQWWNWFLIGIIIHIVIHLFFIVLWHYQTEIRTTIITISYSSTYGAVNAECAICLEHIPNTDILILSCQHCFHRDCLYKWLKHKHNCPICREVV
jgi:hypothetical protein